MNDQTQLVLATKDDNEVLGGPERHIRLITDGSASGGALSTIRVKLGAGDLGAIPHQHRRCTEMFYVLSGAVAVMSGEEIVEAHEGDHFRTLIRIQTGELPPEALIPVADRTDTYFEQSPLWDSHVG